MLRIRLLILVTIFFLSSNATALDAVSVSTAESRTTSSSELFVRTPGGSRITISNRPLWETDAAGMPKQTGLIQSYNVSKASRLDASVMQSLQKQKSISKLSQRTQSAALLGCGNDITVEVLENVITAGSGGLHMPTWLDYKVGAGAYTSAFGGSEVPVGLVSNPIDISSGPDFWLKAKIANPYADPQTIIREIVNDDANFAITLQNNDLLSAKLNEKNAHTGFNGQINLSTILQSYTVNGLIELPANEMLVAYELGTTSPASLAFDFQDLVLKVRTGCPIQSEIVLRDSIGGDNTMTNDTYPMPTSRDASGWTVIPFTVVASQDLILKEVRTIGAQTGPGLDFSQLDYSIMVWSDLNDAISSPNSGTLFHQQVDTPSTTPVQFGQTISQVPIGVKPTWDFRFDLSTYNISIPAGQSRTIGIQVLTNGAGAGKGGIIGWSESVESGPTDVYLRSSSPGQAINLNSLVQSIYDGRVGIKVTGLSQ